ncbi:MAG: CehA/McbA family metallohydrolase [Candidatus Poribacteria bacterium]
MNKKEYFEYVGVLHVHTKYSDGSGSIKKIVKEAKKANLDYVITSDHNSFQALKDGAEGWYDDLLLLVGEEIGVKWSEHYLAVGINEPIKPDKENYNVRTYIEEVKNQGGLGFIAHPYGLRKSLFRLRIASWNSWDDPNYDGIEIWSYMHDWSHHVNIFNIVYRYINPRKIISGPPEHILKKWDELCQNRRVIGIGALDVHAKYVFPFVMIQFLSYRRTFNTVRTHILTSSPLNQDLNASKKTLYDSLKAGHCFFADDYLANSNGFRFEAVLDDKYLIMGDEQKMSGKANLLIETPLPSTIRLIKDGQVLIKEKSCNLVTETRDFGVYRVEARIDDKPWIYSNPIYLRPQI